MFTTTMPKKDDRTITLHIDRTKVSRGHRVPGLGRGGRHQDRRFQKPRSERRRDW